MDEKGKWVLSHFNAVARRYDFMNSLLSFGLHHMWKRAAVRALGLGPREHVLDVCGGTGDLSIRAARAVGEDGRVILYDINRAMMEMGREKVARRSLIQTVFLLQGDAQALPLEEGSFDAVMVGFGIRNVTDMEQALREMYRVLKRGGRLMCLEFSRPKARAFRWLYDLYSFSIMPLAGHLLVGSREAYTYLSESIRMFPPPEEFKAILKEVGFSDVVYRRLTNGIAVIHSGIKR